MRSAPAEAAREPERLYSIRDKYRLVAELLRDAEGTLLDVGARDRRLAQELRGGRLRYFSADVDEGHDYRLDLERPLPLVDRQFDHVVVLDVLEHLEHIHLGFGELARIAAKNLIVALPNLATLPRRLTFLLGGSLRTGKYDLAVEATGDRHRWLTVYPQINAFIAVNAHAAGFEMVKIIEELEGGRIGARAGMAAARLGLLPAGWLTQRCIYYLRRNE
jgi:hypothetical protein